MSETTARRALYARSDRVCERCGVRRATNAHHRRAAGRVWMVENLLDLCGSGTTGCHGWVTEHPKLGRDYGWIVRTEWEPLWRPALVLGRWHYLTRDGQSVLVRDTAGYPDLRWAYPDMREPA